MYSLNVVPPFSSRKKGNTSSRITLSISGPDECLSFDQRRCCCFSEKMRLKGFFVRAARFSFRISATSSSRMNIRNEICSMTVRGLVIPPVQNSVQSLSMSLFCWVVRVLMIPRARARAPVR